MLALLIFLLTFIGSFALGQSQDQGQGDTDRNLTDEAPTGFQSVYTSLEFDDCFTLNLSTWYADEPVDFLTQECPALQGYQVFITGGDLRYWLVLERAGVRFVFRDDVAQALGGAFPYVSGSVLEWRFLWADDVTPQLVALIYRMTRQNPQTFEDTPALVVLRMTGESPCLLGVAESNVVARALADDLTQTCAVE